MNIIDAGFEILTDIDPNILKNLELIGRTCYKSTDKISEGSAERFLRGLIKNKHDAMLEHESVTVKFICDRGVSHEIVRHRMASFAQESTRYCNYTNAKFGSELTFIRPFFFESTKCMDIWLNEMANIEQTYFDMIRLGAKPEEARTVLPNSIKTELIMTANLREWRHFFKLRAVGLTGNPHPQMKEIAIPLLIEMNKRIPIIFEDIINLLEVTNLFMNKKDFIQNKNDKEDRKEN